MMLFRANHHVTLPKSRFTADEKRVPGSLSNCVMKGAWRENVNASHSKSIVEETHCMTPTNIWRADRVRSAWIAMVRIYIEAVE